MTLLRAKSKESLLNSRSDGVSGPIYQLGARSPRYGDCPAAPNDLR